MWAYQQGPWTTAPPRSMRLPILMPRTRWTLLPRPAGVHLPRPPPLAVVTYVTWLSAHFELLSAPVALGNMTHSLQRSKSAKRQLSQPARAAGTMAGQRNRMQALGRQQSQSNNASYSISPAAMADREHHRPLSTVQTRVEVRLLGDRKLVSGSLTGSRAGPRPV